MGKRYHHQQKSLFYPLELIGKPLLFLFTFLLLFVYTYLRLLYLFTQRCFRFLTHPSLPSLPHLPTISLPKLTLNLPKLPPLPTLPTLPTLPRLTLPKLSLQPPKINYRHFLIFTLLFFLVYSLFSFFQTLPNPHLLATTTPSLSTKITDRNGRLLYQIYRDQNRSLISLTDLPSYVIDTTIVAEDKSFYTHPGLSFRGIIRATLNNLTSCQFLSDNCSLQGGSTITQQLVKNALLSPEKSFTRKFKEGILALWTERLYSKAQILEMYLNYVPYGGTAYGIEEGSLQYFDKHASNLTLAEAAFLAGLPVAPTTLSPFGTEPYLAKTRQTQILDAMVESGYLSDSLATSAKNEPINLKPKGVNIRAPHFVMYIKSLLVKQFGEDLVNRGGLTVTTSLDLDKQVVLENSISAELKKLTNLNVNNAAGLIINPPTGEILAMVGSHNFFDTEHDGQVNVVMQPRQPGSTIKPLTYTLAFMQGYTPSSYLDDSPVCFIIAGQPSYCPRNYDNTFHGRVSLRTALASSYNVPAIKLLNSLGVNELVSLAKQLGITTWEDSSRFGLSLTLGGGEVTMFDLAQAYSVFANNGYKVPLRAILSVTSSTGQLITDYSSDNIIFSNLLKNNIGSLKVESVSTLPKQVIPPGVSYQISNILSDNLARAPAFGFNSVLNLSPYQVAVKTGTTNNLRDNWTIGYTPDLLVATWVGNNDNSPMSSVASGITGASPIWNSTMKTLLANSPPLSFTPPEDMVKINTSCSDSPRYEYFLPGTKPDLNCPKPSPSPTPE
ncbi:MAG: transglycosylase domain-containing protein [bacterium]